MAPPRPRPEEDAAPLYERAFAAMTAPIESDIHAALEDDPEPKATPEAIEAWLATQKRAIDDLVAACRLPRCDWRLDYTQGYEIPMPHLEKMREAAKLLRLYAVRQAEKGEADAAVATTIDAIQTARAVESDPLRIARIVGLMCEGHARGGVKRILECRPSERACRDLIAAIDARRPAGELSRALRGERASGIEYFEALRRGQKPAFFDFDYDGERRERELYEKARAHCPWILDRDETTFIETMEELIDVAANAGKRSSWDATRAIWKRCEVSRSRFVPFHLITRTIIPIEAQLIHQEVFAEVHRSTSRAAVALALFRARHGRFPDRLDELVPEVLPDVPQDPWAERPLRYRREGSGFVVYSIGEDLIDGGGPDQPAGEESPDSFDDTGIRVR
jgi:hypothetical protein